MKANTAPAFHIDALGKQMIKVDQHCHQKQYIHFFPFVPEKNKCNEKWET